MKVHCPGWLGQIVGGRHAHSLSPGSISGEVVVLVLVLVLVLQRLTPS